MEETGKRGGKVTNFCIKETHYYLSPILAVQFLTAFLSLQEKGILFALSQIVYGACIFLGYWGYFLFFHADKKYNLFPVR